MRIGIVGAGPAGSHLAWRLAGTEHEVLLFDPRAPWEKPCGGGLSPLVGRRFPEVMALPFPRHRPPSLLLRASDGSQVEYPLASEGWAIVSRADLGRALLERALENRHVRHVRQKVTRLEQSGDGWSLHTSAGKTFSADFVVGADGVHSIVRRRVVGPIPRPHLGLAVGYRVQGAPDAVLFQTFADLGGYLWSFLRPDHANVGIVSRLGTLPARELWQRVHQFLDEVCPGAEKLGRYAALLPMAHGLSLWDTPSVGPNWALLGDAAGHAHPLTGEGIAYALWSAELLAEAFVRGEPQLYDDLWRQAYGDGLMATSARMAQTGLGGGAYEVLFQFTMVMALAR